MLNSSENRPEIILLLPDIYRCIPPVSYRLIHLEKMCVLPHRLLNNFIVLITRINTSGANDMNAVDLLNENEKRILALLLRGLNVSQVADSYRWTPDEVNNIRLQIIEKFEQSSPVRIAETRRFQFISDN